MLIRTRGIVFRSVKYGDTSFISDIYTEAHGLRHFIIGGVRKAKSPTGTALFQPGSALELVSYFRPDKNLHRIKEAKAGLIFRHIPLSIHKTAVQLFMAELCSKTIKESEPNQPLFDFLWQALILLDKTQQPVALLPHAFMCRLTAFLGFAPQTISGPADRFDTQSGHFSYSGTDKTGHIDQLNKLFQSDFGDPLPEAISRETRRAMMDTLMTYFAAHVAGFRKLNTPDIFGEIF